MGCLPQSSGAYAVAKLEDGLLDIAMIGSAPFASAISRGSDIVGVQVFPWGEEGEGLVSTQALSAPTDLVGKTVGVPFGSTSHYHVRRTRVPRVRVPWRNPHSHLHPPSPPPPTPHPHPPAPSSRTFSSYWGSTGTSR